MHRVCMLSAEILYLYQPANFTRQEAVRAISGWGYPGLKYDDNKFTTYAIIFDNVALREESVIGRKGPRKSTDKAEKKQDI